MKRVKRLEEGYYTLESAAAVESVEILCRQCGHSECSIGAIMKRLEVNRYNAVLSVAKCKSFVPVLDFIDASGTESAFNTFRLGAAWAARVEVDQKVAITHNKKPLGYAKVVSVHSGLLSVMLEEHGIDNHLSIAAAINGEEFDLGAEIQKIYGPHRAGQGSLCTVIYLERQNAGGED